VQQKRILLVNDYKTCGGAEKVFLDTAELLQNSFNIKCFFGSEFYKAPGNILQFIHSREFFLKFKNGLLTFKPDLVHLHNYYHFLSPSILRAILWFKRHVNKELKVLMTAHDFHLACPNSGYSHYNWPNNQLVRVEKRLDYFGLFFKKWDQRGISFSLLKQLQWLFNYKFLRLGDVIGKIIAPSAFLGSILQEYTGKDVVVVRNPIKDCQAKGVASLLPQKHLAKKKNLVFAGRLSSEKGLVQFLRDFQALFKHEDIFMDIIGEGAEEQTLRFLIKGLGLENKVFLLGKMSHAGVLEKLVASNAIVLPSIWYENAPLSLVEGALNYCKILTNSFGGMGEIAEICGNFKFLDKVSIREIEDFILDKNFHVNADIAKIFSEDRYVESLTSVYNSLWL